MAHELAETLNAMYRERAEYALILRNGWEVSDDYIADGEQGISGSKINAAAEFLGFVGYTEDEAFVLIEKMITAVKPWDLKDYNEVLAEERVWDEDEIF